MYHVDALVLDLDNTDFVIPDTFLKDAKLTLTSAILNNQQLSTYQLPNMTLNFGR